MSDNVIIQLRYGIVFTLKQPVEEGPVREALKECCRLSQWDLHKVEVTDSTVDIDIEIDEDFSADELMALLQNGVRQTLEKDGLSVVWDEDFEIETRTPKRPLRLQEFLDRSRYADEEESPDDGA